MSAVLADRLQIWGFDKNFIVFADGSLGFGLELTPVDVSCWNEERINSLATRLIYFLNGLSPGLDLQFIQEISGGNSLILDRHASLCTAEASNAAKTLTQMRISRLRELDAQGIIPKHSLKLFVRKPMGRHPLAKPKLFSKVALFPKVSAQEMDREIAAFERLLNDIMEKLRPLGLQSNVLSADQIMDLMYQQWNPSRPIDRGYVDPENVRSSLLFTDVANDEKGFSLGGTHFRVISLKLLPEQTFASMATVLRELPFDSRLFLTIHVPDQQKEIETLQIQRRLAYSMARGKKTGVSDIESEAKFQDLETLIAEMVAQGEKVFHVSFNILLRAKSLDDLESQVAQTLGKVRELAAAEAMEESLASFEIFSELSIPNAKAKERMKRMKTSTLADLLPVYAPWEGHATPSILLRSRMGSIVGVDPFSQNNFNQVLSGASGAGKSYLCNILLLQMMQQAPKTFIIDIGGSYKKICNHLEGQYIALGVDSGLSINPFDLPTGMKVPDSHTIKFILGLIENMTKEDGDSRLPRLERAEIEEAIQKVYERTSSPRLSVLREILLEHQNVEIRRYGRILTPWCGDTPYGRFFDRDTKVALERPIVCFDLKDMEAYPDLQAICLLIITDYVWKEVQKDRSTKKFIVFDECWKLLESENGVGAAFIGEIFRTIRKYLGSAIAISQTLEDFAKSKVAGAILANSAFKWILMQRGADQARLKEVLQLNDSEMELIASLRQEHGLYSEAFLMAGDERAVVTIESTALEYWFATSDARDLAAIDAATKENPDQPALEILSGLAKRYPRGVLSSAKDTPMSTPKKVV